jgi:endonuclease/exonuclease/phosphatase family metal-dependent hydrolase
MQFRVSSWNVNNRNFRGTHAELLRRVDTDLLALQEVSPSFYQELTGTGLFDWSEFSLSLRPPQREEGRSRRLGCAVFGRSPFQKYSAQLLAELPFPERALIVKINSGVEMRMCSFHTPPGASWGKIKPQTLRAIAEWLAKQSGHTIFGIDANAPKTDHPMFEQNKWWWGDEPTLLGHSPLHKLRDCLRLYLAERPHLLQEIVSRRPAGPLAISHIRGNRRKMIECRYDFIYISPGLDVVDVNYLYGESVQAGSDHALVTALLKIRAEPHGASI